MSELEKGSTSIWKLAWSLLKRDHHSGEWRVLLLALLIGVGSVSTTGFLGDRMQRMMAEKGAEFLGADLQVSSSREVGNLPENSDLKATRVLDFSSMLSKGDAFQLSAVRAVDEAFPLRGELRISDAPGGADRLHMGPPKRGEVFVDPQLLSLLSVQVGDTVDLGAAQMRVAAVISAEPGSGGMVFGLAPRVFMHQDDVAATQVLQPGSRVTWLYQFAGELAAVKAYAAQVKPALEPSQRMQLGQGGTEAVGNAFTRSDRFIGLASLVSLLLSAVAVALAARRHAARHFDQAALLRCFGLTRAQLRNLYLTQLIAIGLLGSAAGVLLGAVTHHLLLSALVPAMAGQIPTLGWMPVLAGMGSGLLALLGAAGPSLLRLARVAPLRVLRRDLDPLPLSAWLTGALSAATLVGLCVWTAGNLKLVGYFVGGLAGLALVVALLSQAMLLLGGLIRRMAQGPLRFGLAQMLRHRGTSTVQIGAFSLALFLMASVALIRSDLIAAWQAQLPKDAPNHFLVNIAPAEKDAVDDWLKTAGMPSTLSYPMVRGRITHLNDQPILEAVPESGREYNAIRRELNLTGTGTLPERNTVTDGVWHAAGDGSAQISVEAVMMKTLGLKLGDSLRFKIGAEELSARITSVRDVKWDSMQPNFYVIFSPGTLSDASASYIKAVHVPKARKAEMTGFVKAFPTVNLLVVDKILADIEAVVAQIVGAIELLLVFLLMAGVAVMAAALLSSLDERRQEAVMLRTLGARKAFVRNSLWAEFLLLGGLAGLLGAVCTELLMFSVAEQIFELEGRWHPWLWWGLPLAGAALVASSSWLATRRIAEVSPIQALRALA